jgi:hypothetical protein
MGESNARKIGFLAAFTPRQFGIAMFTRDLHQAVTRQQPEWSSLFWRGRPRTACPRGGTPPALVRQQSLIDGQRIGRIRPLITGQGAACRYHQ